MMQLALSQGDYEVLEYDVHNNRFVNRYGSHLLPPEGVNMQQFISMVHPDNHAELHHANKQMFSGKVNNNCLELRIKPYGSDGEWRFMRSYAVVERDKHQVPQKIVCTVKDITEEYEQMHRDSELAKRFSKMFEYSLVGMSFYKADGQIIDLNRMMRKICEVNDQGESVFLSTKLFDFPSIKDDFDMNGRDSLHACQHIIYPEAGIDKYIEYRILPTYDNDRLQYYVMTCRDITAEREIYLEQRRLDKELRSMNEQLNLHEKELSYLLNSSNMWVWRSEVATQQIIFSRSLKQDGFSISFDDYMSGLYEEERAKALEAFGNMKGADKDINVTLHLRHFKGIEEPHWYAINGIPVHDDQGHVTGHFGVVRDVTELMNAQEQLLLETSRAEDSGKLKSVFLANMTHEIRTPLNAIVGFSDLLQYIDDKSERREFMRIIRNNCDMLIRLINDIIEASAMNQGPLAIESKDVDFAVAFNDICQTLAQRVQEPGVQFLVDNPYTTFPTHLDKGRLQQVITNFTTNAVKYTQKGHIKVGYRYQDGGIYMYCEDTGTGIPKEKQAMVFDRFVKLNDFVQGTGLGLSICKNIADRCGGRIGVESEGEGHGSTFWIWIPCPQLNNEKE
jgi:signal transduction histidine kinase